MIIIITENKKDTGIYEEFQRGEQYLSKNQFLKMESICKRFYIGDQWEEEIPEETKSIPRPVINQCKLIVDTKASNVLSIPVKLRFITANDNQSTTFFSQFSEYLLKEMKHERNKQRYVKNALITGTAVQHMYWNDKKFGAFGDYVGGLEEEYIDMKNVALSNPSNKDIQSQEYIIIRSRKTYKVLINMLEDKSKIKFIKPDSMDYENSSKEIDDSDLCTCYLKYYRKNGEVYHTLATREVIIYGDKPMNPNLYTTNIKKPKYYLDLLKLNNKNEEEIDIDSELSNLPDEKLENETEDNYSKNKFYRYPVNFLVLTESYDSAYGISELKSNINTQKAINHLYSMQLLNVMNTAWDKYVVQPNALINQTITDQPGQVLVDYSKTGNGIKRLGGMNAMGNGTIELSERLFNISKSVSQVNDVFTGETSQKDLSGVAITQLQNQNDKPIDSMRKALWSFEEEMGKTLELFMKMYYSEQKYYYEIDDATIIRNKTINDISSRLGTPSNLPTEKYQESYYESDKFMNIPFHITVEAVQGTKDSEVMLMSIIQSLFLNGSWNNMDIHAKKFFVEMYPLPEKEKFKALLEAEERDYISKIESDNQQLQGIIQQLTNAMKRNKNVVDYLGNINKSLQSQFKNEVNAHNKDIKQMDKLVESQEKGASESNNINI